MSKGRLQGQAPVPWAEWGSTLRELREMRGESQSSLARALGVTRQRLYTIERGARVPDPKRYVGRLAAHWRMQEDELLARFRCIPDDVLDVLAENPALVSAIREAGG